MAELANPLKTLREKGDFLQAKIALQVGAIQASMNRYERGRANLPVKVPLRHANFTSLPLDHVFGCTNKPQARYIPLSPKSMEAQSQDKQELQTRIEMYVDPKSLRNGKLKKSLLKGVRE